MTSAVLTELEDSNGVIKARIDEAVVKERLSTGIYSDPRSAIRELYANELRACREARRRGLCPAIEVAFNWKDRTLTIQGADSLGITRKKFADVLAVLGETDNQSGAEIGQWGIGHMAFRAISDAILFGSYSLETGERFAYVGNGEVYQEVPAVTRLDKTGMRVTVTLKDDVNMLELIASARQVCRYSEVDTFLTVVDEDGDADGEPEKVNLFPSIAGGLQNSNADFPVEVDDEDFTLYTSIREMKGDTKVECDTLLLRMPIDAPLLKEALPFQRSILNIKDERKYRPTADRERLTEQAQKDILARVIRRVREKLPESLDLKTIDDYRNSPHKEFYISSLYCQLKDLYSPSNETKEISELVGLQVKECRLEPEGSTKSSLAWVLQSSKNVFYSERISKEVLYVLREEYDDAALFKLEDRWNVERYIRLLRKYGIRFDAQEEYERIKAWLRPGWRNNIPRGPSAGEEVPYEIVVHESSVSSVEQRGSTYHRLTRFSRKHETRFGFDGIIFVEDLTSYLPILNEVHCNYRLSKANRKIPDVLTLEGFIGDLRKKEVETSVGRVAFEELESHGKPIQVLVHCDATLSSMYKPEGVVFAAATPEMAFELALWCRCHDLDYKISHVISEHEFLETTGTDRSRYFNRFYYDDFATREESYEPDAMAVANCAFHLSLAVKDPALVSLYLKAVEGSEDGELARKQKDFVLDLWEKSKNSSHS